MKEVFIIYKTKIGPLEEHFCKVWMLFSWKIIKTCLGQLERKTAILDFRNTPKSYNTSSETFQNTEKNTSAMSGDFL
jgi:hypothetical protein